jgi:hypothetical protein
VTSLALPPLAALALLYLLALAGIAPSPAFPFDPGQYALGVRAAIVMFLLAGTLAAGYQVWWTRGRERYDWPDDEGTPAAVGAVLVAAIFVVWLENPYLALLLVPVAHAWLVAARPPGVTRAGIVIAALAISLIPILAAIDNIADRLDLGASTPWTFLVMTADGQISLLESVCACVIAGALAGLLIMALRRPTGLDPMEPGVRDQTGLDISPIRSQPAPDDLYDEN